MTLLRCSSLLVSFLLVSGCVTTYADGRTESTFDGVRDGLRQLFRRSPDRSWRYEDVEPRNFLRPGGGSILLAPPPENPDDPVILKNVPEVLDQGRMPAGPIFAAGYIANSMLHMPEMSSYRCSPAFLFRMLNGSESRAVELQDTLEFLKTSGCARMSLAPFRTPADYDRLPDQMAVRDALNFRINGYARVDLTDIEQIRNHLSLGRVVITSLVLPENLIDFHDDTFDRPEGDVVGRQTFALIGYDAKKARVLLQNSMGKDWGDGGRIWVSVGWYIRMVIDAYVLY